jgi:hypothetical protein
MFHSISQPCADYVPTTGSLRSQTRFVIQARLNSVDSKKLGVVLVSGGLPVPGMPTVGARVIWVGWIWLAVIGLLGWDRVVVGCVTVRMPIPYET